MEEDSSNSSNFNFGNQWNNLQNPNQQEIQFILSSLLEAYFTALKSRTSNIISKTLAKSLMLLSCETKVAEGVVDLHLLHLWFILPKKELSQLIAKSCRN